MDDVGVVVRVVDRIAELAHPIAQFGRLKDLALFIAAQTGKGVAIDIFHRNAARAFVVHKVVNAHDVLVGEFQATSGLALEIAQYGSIVNDQVGEKFERDIALQFFVVRQPDNSHSASAQNPNERVTAKSLCPLANS